MTAHPATEDADPSAPSTCWCCGAVDDPTELVHLGNHPEVTVCVRCAHSLSKRAWELEDQGRTGTGVRLRDTLRRVRTFVVRHGWHQNKIIGSAVRRIGRFTP